MGHDSLLLASPAEGAEQKVIPSRHEYEWYADHMFFSTSSGSVNHEWILNIAVRNEKRAVMERFRLDYSPDRAPVIAPG